MKIPSLSISYMYDVFDGFCVKRWLYGYILQHACHVRSIPKGLKLKTSSEKCTFWARSDPPSRDTGMGLRGYLHEQTFTIYFIFFFFSFWRQKFSLGSCKRDEDTRRVGENVYNIIVYVFNAYTEKEFDANTSL